jgi:hypothetical protein
LEEFHAHDDPGVITIIYAHGARVTEYRAFARLPLIYDALVECLPPDVRVRMVMFSWPNPKSVRVLNDFRRASVQACPHSQYLAWLVANIDPQVRVSLMSFSLGAQLVTGALESLSADGGPGDQRRMRVVMWTAAETNTWIEPGGPHGHAMDSIDRLLLVNNSCDPVLRRYALMSPCSDPVALGFYGLPNLQAFGADASRIRQYDGGAELGATHGYRDHLEAPTVVALTRPYVFWQDVDAACQPAAPLEMISARPR